MQNFYDVYVSFYLPVKALASCWLAQRLAGKNVGSFVKQSAKNLAITTLASLLGAMVSSLFT